MRHVQYVFEALDQSILANFKGEDRIRRFVGSIPVVDEFFSAVSGLNFDMCRISTRV